MKKKISILIAAMSISSTASAFSWGPMFDSEWMLKDPQNKISHMVVAAPAAWWITKNTGCPWMGIGAMTLFGTFTEATDLHFSRPDLYSWIAGGIIGAGYAYFIDKNTPKECGATPYEKVKYQSLNRGSQAMTALMLAGANPYIGLGTGIAATLWQWQIEQEKIIPTEEWPYRLVVTQETMDNTVKPEDTVWPFSKTYKSETVTDTNWVFK